MINRKEYNYDIAGLVEGIAELKADYISSMYDISDLESDVANEDINDDTMSKAILELDERVDDMLALVNDQGADVNQMDERIFDMDERVSTLVEADELSGLVSDILGDEVDDFVADYVCNNDIASRDDVHEIVADAIADAFNETAMDMRDVAKDAILDYLPVYFDQMMAERRAKSLLGRILAFSDRLHWRMPCR